MTDERKTALRKAFTGNPSAGKLQIAATRIWRPKVCRKCGTAI